MHLASDLRAALLKAATPAQRAVLDAWVPLDETLEALLQEARDRWPGVSIAADLFGAHLAQRLGPEEEIPSRLGQLHGADLYLACASLHGAPGAVEAFESRVVAHIEPSIRKVCREPDDVAEVRAQLLEKLLVSGERPRIASYEGRGPLVGWTRVAATRLALDHVRGQRHATELDDADRAVEALDRDPELAGLKRAYREHFRNAVRTAISELSERNKTILRYHLIDRLSIDRIAELYRVDRSTAARWLKAVRERIFKHTRAELMHELKVDAEEFQSIVRLLQSRMDVTLASLL